MGEALTPPPGADTPPVERPPPGGTVDDDRWARLGCGSSPGPMCTLQIGTSWVASPNMNFEGEFIRRHGRTTPHPSGHNRAW